MHLLVSRCPAWGRIVTCIERNQSCECIAPLSVKAPGGQHRKGKGKLVAAACCQAGEREFN